MLSHLQWIERKFALKSDVLLLGPPSQFKSRLASEFCRLKNMKKPVIVSLTRDVTVNDLRDQRNLVDNELVVLQGPVLRAAVEGRVLILNGLNKAELRVLPMLHELLENRAMDTSDGGFLLSSKRFDELDVAAANSGKFYRCSDDFHVIATAVPVPPFVGSGLPLDPPLRSRLTTRYVESIGSDPELSNWMPDDVPIDESVWRQVCAFALALRQHQFASSLLDADTLSFDAMVQLSIALQRGFDDWKAVIVRVLPNSVASSEAVLIAGERFLASVQSKQLQRPTIKLRRDIVSTLRFDDALRQLLVDYQCGRHSLVLGATAKTTLVRAFAQHIKQAVDTIHCHDALSSRDLLMLRTASGGHTGWQDGPLLRAAMNGRIVVLDGVFDHLPTHQVNGMLAMLITDRRLQLPDGSTLIDAAAYDAMPANARSDYRRMSPAFRIIAVSAKAAINLEVLEIFSVVRLDFDTASFAAVLRSVASEQTVNLLLAANQHLKLTLTQLMHCARRATAASDDLAVLRAMLERESMRTLLPPEKGAPIDNALDALGLPKRAQLPLPVPPPGFSTMSAQLAPVRAKQAVLIPNVIQGFVDLPSHMRVMGEMCQDMMVGQSLIVLGLQGTGKNRIVDTMLSHLHWPRVYISLTSESTVSSFLNNPQVVKGELSHADTPLVLAARTGCVLVVDEADKSRASATLSFLRGLVDGSGVDLGDGRRLIPANLASGAADEIVIHPLFRMILLCNPPTYPFQGESVESIRHLFATHVVDALSFEDEVLLLQAAVGADAPVEILRMLARAFAELRELHARGLLSYPLSTREAIAAARHIVKYRDDVLSALESAFVHDMYDAGSRSLIRSALSRAGFRIDETPSAGERGFLTPGSGLLVSKTREQLTLDSLRGPIGSPKAGKIDPNNAPHVGGNTWQGGTGGRDTAGLGGVGGPYRIDAGHAIHQVSDEVKRNASKEVQDAARKMGAAELAKRLTEIGMSEFEFQAYNRFKPAAVVEGIAQLRSILAALKALRNEGGDDDDDDKKNQQRRGWIHNQNEGEFDVQRIVDALAGDPRVFKRKAPIRDYTKHWLNNDQDKKDTSDEQAKNDGDDDRDKDGGGTKHIRVVLDLSASMFRFNSFDRRLERLMQAVVLLLEGFEAVPNVVRDDKTKTPLTFDIAGHSGDSPHIDLKRSPTGEANQAEHWRIVQTLAAHPQMCWAGDNTLEAAALAVSQLQKTLRKSGGGHGVVVLISDANLRRYGITAGELAAIMDKAKRESKTDLHVIFIADLSQEADQLQRQLPIGLAHVCRDVATLPDTLRTILLRSLVAK